MHNKPYYEEELPISSPVAGSTPTRGGEVRLYKDVGYLLVDVASAVQLMDGVGQKHGGLTRGVLAIELRENIGNIKLRDLLREAADLIDPEEVVESDT